MKRKMKEKANKKKRIYLKNKNLNYLIFLWMKKKLISYLHRILTKYLGIQIFKRKELQRQEKGDNQKKKR